jgi:DNA polymerase III gamma/tau subunit
MSDQKEAPELYKRYRPKKLSDVVGQDTAISAIRKAIAAGKFPHSTLINGPTGTGKTTLMRIIRKILKCSDQDYVEINTADFRGIDTIRSLRHNMPLQPIGGDTRVIGIDECHSLSKDGQNAILKMLEDTPDHVYFILGTTDPHKLLPAVIGRCTEYKLRAISCDHLEALIKSVIEKEKLCIADGILEEVAIAAEGSARKALVILDAISKEEGEEAQKLAIQVTTVNKERAYLLASELMWPKKGWATAATLLQQMKDEEPEGIRHMVLAFARSCLVGKEGKEPNPRNCSRAATIINFFGTNFYDSKHAGLAFACWNVMISK